MSEEKDIVIPTETGEEKKGMNIEERDEYSLFTDRHLRSLHDELPIRNARNIKNKVSICMIKIMKI